MNRKQKLFCDFYIKYGNATKAAKEAGYSEKTCYSLGQRLLKNVEISKYIDDETKKLIGDRDERLKRLTKIMRFGQDSDVIRAIIVLNDMDEKFGNKDDNTFIFKINTIDDDEKK